MAFDPALLDLFARLRGGSLITLKRDGRPHASVVLHAWDAETTTILVSLTDDRVKTRNLRRDPRASYEVVSPDLSGWAVGEGIAELTPTAEDRTTRPRTPSSSCTAPSPASIPSGRSTAPRWWRTGGW